MEMKETTLEEVARTTDFVEFVEGDTPGVPDAIIAAEKGSAVDLRELGNTSTSPWLSWLHREYNTQLIGVQGLRKYDEMRRSDSTVRGTLRMIKTPVLSARWFMVPGSDSTRDKNVAEKIWWNLTEGMTTSWPQFLSEALLMLDFGHYCFEKVFTNSHPQAPTGMGICWKKLAPRHPLDITDWETDANGGPNGIKMYVPDNDHGSKEISIPIGKLLVFTNDKEAGDMTGVSLLRSAFKPWYYKSQLEKIDAIQKERHGIGVPIIKLPPNFNDVDKRIAQAIGRNLRTNEQAHVVLPPNWEILFAKLEGQPVSALDSIEYHNKEITKNILASFIHDDGGKDEDKVLFLKSTRYVADIIEDVFNKYLIPQLVDYNWSKVKYPKLKARRIGEQADWRTMSFAIRNLVGAGIIRPDDVLEANLREEMDLPMADVATTRIVRSPQAGPGGAPGVPSGPQPPAPSPAQLPRQKPTPPIGTPAANAGTDRSG